MVLVIVAGLVAWGVVSGDDIYRPDPGAAPSRAANPTQAAATLRALERAITDNDVGAAEALADPATSGLVAALVRNAAAGNIDDVTFRYIDAITDPDAEGRWSAAVAVTWCFAGFDREAASAEVVFDFTSVGDDVRLAGIGGADLRTPLWLDGPIDVERGAGFLVTAPTGTDAALYARLARQAVVVVRRVLVDWRPRLVVEVASSGLALERALLVEPGSYAQIAAVTGSGDGSIAEGAPIHVYVNPDVMSALDRNGQQVVLSHEATHVATDAPRSQAPTWLVEGFADYVALRDTNLSTSVTAAQIAGQVRREGVPLALPVPGDFDTLTTHLGAVYESAWLACVTIFRRLGERGLVRVYETASSGVEVDQVLARVGQWSEAGLLAAWQRLLASLA